MMGLLNNQKAFLVLVRAGLWENEVQLLTCGKIDYKVIRKLAEEQSLVGIVAAGLEHVVDIKIPKEDILTFAGGTLQIEQRNQAMNLFIQSMIGKMRSAGIYTLLVKGQGVAQCYERPDRRASGDIDLFLSENNYDKAKMFLSPLAANVEKEGLYTKHLGIHIGQWVVELHGSLRCSLSSRMDRVLDDIKHDTFYGGNVRSWMNGREQIFLLSVENDILFVFSYLLKHFYIEGLGLR